MGCFDIPGHPLRLPSERHKMTWAQYDWLCYRAEQRQMEHPYPKCEGRHCSACKQRHRCYGRILALT